MSQRRFLSAFSALLCEALSATNDMAHDLYSHTEGVNLTPASSGKMTFKSLHELWKQLLTSGGKGQFGQYMLPMISWFEN